MHDKDAWPVDQLLNPAHRIALITCYLFSPLGA
jgi:hypothetical protein